jgi:hypothetical protein
LQRRFKQAMVSRCYCCETPTSESIDHIFYSGNMARKVWDFFAASTGVHFIHRGIRTLLHGWWRYTAKSRMHAFLFHRLPIIILWELWTHYAACKYGGESPSFPRIRFRVAKAVAECVFRRWPAVGLLPPHWHSIVDFISHVRGRRTSTLIRWTRPPPGYVKINVARAHAGGGYAAIVRDCSGMFLFAYSTATHRWDPVVRGAMEAVNKCLEWCISQSLLRIHLESHHSEIRPLFEERTPWYLDDICSRLRFLCSCATVIPFVCHKRANAPAASLAEWAAAQTEGAHYFTDLQDLDVRVRSLLSMEDLPDFEMAEDGGLP